MSGGLSKAEFDSFADEYREMHHRNIAISGEGPEFFAEYKISDLANFMSLKGQRVRRILDFGSGVGNSIPWFRKYFPEAELTCADVSARSIDISRERFPGPEIYAEIQGDALPLPEKSFDLVFSACVFHHIPQGEHVHWLGELRRVARLGGNLVIFEHNPLNPLTVRAVNTCPFDVNARLIGARKLQLSLTAADWRVEACRYRIFFPGFLAALRPLEKYLYSLALGAQYFVVGHKPSEIEEPER